VTLKRPQGRTVDTCPLVRFMSRCVSPGLPERCALCSMVDWSSEVTRQWTAAWREDDGVPVPRKPRRDAA